MSSDDEYENNPVWKGESGTIILINVFQNNTLNTFVPAHLATCRLIRKLLRSASTQYVGVCIFGTEESNATVLDSKSIVQVIPLSLPTIDDFKKLKDTKVQSFPESKELIFSEALWHCSKMFLNIKKQFSSKRILILTPLNVPPAEVDKNPTLKRVEDLVESGINIKIINVSSDEALANPFYEKFYAKANKGINLPLPSPKIDPTEIEEVMHQESHRNLAVAKLNFEIGENVDIGVGLYKLVRSRQNFHKTSNLHGESNSVLTSVTKTLKVNVDSEYLDTDVGESEVPLLKSEQLYYVEYGGERVEFTNTEMNKMKNSFGPPMLKLLGFKPNITMCKEKWFAKAGYFLFPDEEGIEGSTIAFKALHTACLDMSVVALCVMCSRVNAKAIHVALSPCSKPLDLDIEIGFDVIQIPFGENVRDLNISNENYTIEIQNKRFMKELINQTRFDYKSNMFENPKLQSEYRAMEVIALDEEDIEPFVDTTKPSSSKFQDVRDDIFEELFGPFHGLNLKRPAASTSKNQSKKPKLTYKDEKLLMKRVRNGNVDQYTISELREILRSIDIQTALTGLTKTDLVMLVYKNV